MIRARVIETPGADYVAAARAKGASEFRVLRSHVLRPALLPLATMIGMDLGGALMASIYIETVYGMTCSTAGSILACDSRDAGDDRPPAARPDHAGPHRSQPRAAGRSARRRCASAFGRARVPCRRGLHGARRSRRPADAAAAAAPGAGAVAARCEANWRIALEAALPSTVGVSVLGALGLAAGNEVLAALLAGGVAGMGIASALSLFPLLAWERERGARLYAGRGGRRFVA
jgi:hypothetical protein